MKTTAQNLSNNILFRAKREKIPVSPMKLQKRLYYVCVQYVKITGVYPIFERFEPWPYGPVIPSIYFEFKSYGSSPIKTYCKDAKGNSRMVDEDVNPTLKYCKGSKLLQVYSFLKERTKNLLAGTPLIKRTERS